MGRVKQYLYDFFLLLGFQVRRTTSSVQVQDFANFLRPKVPRDGLQRLGGGGDGGYLVPVGLKCEKLFSAGVDDSVSFELDYQKLNPESKIYLIDGSIERLPREIENVHFSKQFLGHMGLGVDEISLDSWLEDSGADATGNILQMDIEGAEWHLFGESKKETWDRFDCIIVELHGLEQIFDPVFFRERVLRLMRVLDDFHVVHLHVNNAGFIQRALGGSIPSLVEVTLVHSRTDLATKENATLPNSLDRINVPGRRNLDVHKAFHGFW